MGPQRAISTRTLVVKQVLLFTHFFGQVNSIAPPAQACTSCASAARCVRTHKHTTCSRVGPRPGVLPTHSRLGGGQTPVSADASQPASWLMLQQGLLLLPDPSISSLHSHFLRLNIAGDRAYALCGHCTSCANVGQIHGNAVWQHATREVTRRGMRRNETN